MPCSRSAAGRTRPPSTISLKGVRFLEFDVWNEGAAGAERRFGEYSRVNDQLHELC